MEGVRFMLTHWKSAFLLSNSGKRAAAAWFFCSGVLSCLYPSFEDPAHAAAIPLPYRLGGFLVTLALFTLAALIPPGRRIENALLGSTAFFYAWVLVRQYSGPHPMVFCAAVLTALVLLLLPLLHSWKGNLPLHQPTSKSCLIVFLLSGLGFAVFIGGLTCLRYANYTAPNYDFGIFCQMFHSMKNGFLPMVTCERDRLLSHFAVHISPVYYLLLPAYWLFPSPYTLQIGQAVVLASGLIPLYVLTKRYGLSYKIRMLLAVLYALYPALGAGCFYDIHENCFLTPLLLWVFVGYESGHTGWMFAAAAGVLMIKEDAAAYLIGFALYLWLAKREHRLAAGLAAVATVYFTLAIVLLNQFGEGAMFGRYDNLSAGDGILGAVQTVLCNPGYLLTQLFKTSSGNGGKLFYLFELLAPLGFLPLLSKKWSRCWLLSPLLLNLLTLYPYQYEIGFQYSFGITAFLFYLTVMNAADLSSPKRRCVLPLAVLASCLIFTMVSLPPMERQLQNWTSHRESYREMDAILETIPEEASVTASCMLVAHLSQRTELYELAYHQQPDTDYLILDIRPGYCSESQAQAELYREVGYTTLEEYPDLLEILVHPAYQPDDVLMV